MNEWYHLCLFILGRELKQSEVEIPYSLYQKSSTKSIIRYLLLMLKYYECQSVKRYPEIPKLVVKCLKEINFPFLVPLLYEKVIQN